MKKNVLSTSDELYNNCDKRCVIFHDEDYQGWVRDDFDHIFVLYSNLRDYRGDKDAECPYHENEDGKMIPDEDKIIFPVSIYDHSGITYSLGEGRNFPDFQWDVTSNAFFLYTGKKHYEMMCGKGTWNKVKDDRDYLRKIALDEVNEMNLAERGCYFGYRVEHKRKWTKTYDDGTSSDGYDWEVDDERVFFLTDNIDDIDFPKEPDLPVFTTEDTFFVDETYEVKE